MDKLITIIIPSYNMERYLVPCCKSLLQDETVGALLEVLVVNDGSKDGTLTVARVLEREHPNVVRCIDKPNGNYGSCINRGLAEATGKYIKVLDADDSVDARNFAAFVEFVRRVDRTEPDVDLFLSDYCVVGPDGRVTGRHPLGLDDQGRITVKDLAAHGPLVMHNILYRTSLLREMGYRQTEGISYTDNEWCFLPVVKIRAARYFRRDVYRYLVGREGQTVGSAATSRSQKMFQTVLESMTTAYQRSKSDVGADGGLYLQKSLTKLMGTMYVNCALRVPIAEAHAEFRTMDEWVRMQLPELYEQPASAYFSNLFHFEYVKFLRTHGLAASRLYLRLIRMTVMAIDRIKR